MNPNLSNSHIILVDDESINLTIMEISLEEQGCKVTKFRSAKECLTAVESSNLKNYDCLVTDYSMPGLSGIELLENIKKIDPTLEVILVTGENERGIIQESLRQGAFDFLDKPLNLEKFYNSIERAVLATSQRRKRDATEASLIAARSTGLFNTIDTTDWSTNIDLIYNPKHELGGDFIEVFETSTKQHCAIFGDISGHDIQSALLSSHFLGNLNGRRSIQSNLDIPTLLESYNTLLLKRAAQSDWNPSFRVGSSLGVCAIEILEENQSIKIINCGLPFIYLIGEDGDVTRMDPQHHPLGWFEDLKVSAESFQMNLFHHLYGFTDGLVEFAMKYQWDVLSLIHHLRTLNKSDTQSFLINADDDILLANIEFHGKSSSVIPFIYNEFPGNATGKVDRFQRIWKNSLQLVLPNVESKKTERFLLACREAVLNGMKHGCKGGSKMQMQFLVKYHPSDSTLEAIVTDPGEGHTFNYQERDQQLLELNPGHLGLVLISKLVDSMELENNGATLRFKMKV